MQEQNASAAASRDCGEPKGFPPLLFRQTALVPALIPVLSGRGRGFSLHLTQVLAVPGANVGFCFVKA